MPEATQGVRAVVRGGERVMADLVAMDARVDAATVLALKAMQNAAKRNVRSRMRGAPRWAHRGASSRTGAAVNVGSGHRARSGGPGRLDCALYRGVGGVRKPKARGANTFVGGVGIGIRVTNLYKRQVEAKYPYLKPGVDKTTAEAGPIWAKAWNKAIHR